MKDVKQAISLILLVFLLSLASFANADFLISVNSKGIINEKPSCSFRGKPVVYSATTANWLKTNNARLAATMMNWSTKTPTIYYDEHQFAEFDPVFQYWVFSHECAHWKLGHLLNGYNKGGSEYEEKDADCRAAKDIVQVGFNEQQIDVILNQITVEQAAYAASLQRSPPSVDGRAIRVQACMEEQFQYQLEK